MDFDTRLHVLTPVATGVSVEKSSSLWESYKRAKSIRNSVTHTGRRVRQEDVEFVIETVHSWLSYLGRTVSLEMVLMNLKRVIESETVSLDSEAQVLSFLPRYFQRATVASGSPDLLEVIREPWFREADFLLQFGRDKVLLEAKFGDVSPQVLGKQVATVHETIQLDLVNEMGISQAVVLSFSREPLPEGFEHVRKYHDGTVYFVGIETRR